MALKKIEVGFHIARGELEATKLAAIIDRKPFFSQEQRQSLLDAHNGLTQATPPHDLLIMKFRRAGRRIGADGAEVGTIGRYHYWRNCLYFSEEIESVFAEAAYYMHILDESKVGNYRRNYKVISAKVSELPVSIFRRFPKEDLICDSHPLQKVVEDKAIKEGWRVISAPSARRDGRRNIAVYDAAMVADAREVETVELHYNVRGPSVTWRTGLIARQGFVIRTTLF
jgi:RES domain